MHYIQKLDTLLPKQFIPVVIVGAQFVIELCTKKLQLTVLSFKKIHTGGGNSDGSSPSLIFFLNNYFVIKTLS